MTWEYASHLLGEVVAKGLLAFFFVYVLSLCFIRRSR
jgi:hypothetical protein